MADGSEVEKKGEENPFSFKNFVHPKKQDSKTTLPDKRKKEKALQAEAPSSSSKAKKDKYNDDVPFPDVVEEKSESRNAGKGRRDYFQKLLRGGANVVEEGASRDAEDPLNPFSFKSFMAQDIASKKKRVLQIIDDEVHEVKVPSDINRNGECTGDQSYRVGGSQTDSSDSDSEQNDRHTSAESPKSGSVHYFVAPPESSDAQALVIEKLNQLKEENEILRKKLQRSHDTTEEQKRKVTSLHKKLAMIEKREAGETAALENMVQMVERNLELTTQRALRAETTVGKLRDEVKLLKTKSVPLDSYNELLEAHISTLRVVKEKSRSAAEQMSAAAKNAEQSIKQMLSGVDTLKFVSSQLESIDRITEVPPSTTDS